MSRKIIHAHVDIRTALVCMSDEELVEMFHCDGQLLTPHFIKGFLVDELLEGRRVLSVDDACEGFDYVTGCPGHVEQLTTFGRLAPVCFPGGVQQ